MPSQWDHRADKDLLLAIIEGNNLKNIAWPDISEKMKSKGYTFTHEACRQHFQKIRKEARNGVPDTAPTTPAKGKATSAETPGSRGKGLYEKPQKFRKGDMKDTPVKKRKYSTQEQMEGEGISVLDHAEAELKVDEEYENGAVLIYDDDTYDHE